MATGWPERAPGGAEEASKTAQERARALQKEPFLCALHTSLSETTPPSIVSGRAGGLREASRLICSKDAVVQS
eukprot:1833881-Pyramimonas_sp.AAC.1